MADPDRTLTTDPLEDTDTATDVTTVRLEGRVAPLTRPTRCTAISNATITTIGHNIRADADSRRPVQSTTIGSNPTVIEHQDGEVGSLSCLRENVRSQFKEILAEVQRITTPLPEVYQLEICLENLLREQTNLRKLDSDILYLFDEELEDETEHADLYTYCFYRAKALLNNYIPCRHRRVLLEIEPPDHCLQELIAKLEDVSAHSRR